MMKLATFHEQSAMEKLLKEKNNLQHTVFVPLTWINSFAPSVVEKFKDPKPKYVIDYYNTHVIIDIY